jgi:DNA polymerase
MPNPWELHIEKWTGCIACPLHEGRRNVVLARGQLPCQVLFIGEAPGESEDVEGAPFVGPAGQLLDSIIADSIPSTIRCAFTNVVACIPKEDGRKSHEGPTRECAKACEGRLREFVHIAQPLVIVQVGEVARKFVDGQAQFYPEQYQRLRDFGGYELPWLKNRAYPFIEWCNIDHPSFILRMPSAQKNLARHRCCTRLASMVRDSKHLSF